MSKISDAIKGRISRRTFLKGAGSLAAAPLLTGLGGRVLTGRSSSAAADTGSDSYKTKLVILGSAGGVSYFPVTDRNRASSSTALVVNDTIYLVDLGQGSVNRLNQAFNTDSLVNSDGSYVDNPSSTFLSKVKALFFTHLHQDHIADYANLLLIGAGAGLGSPSQTDLKAQRPLEVIGPCDRGRLDINNNPVWTKDWKIKAYSYPDAITPTPGTIQMTDTIFQAFAQAINDIMMDDGYPDYKSLVSVREIGKPLPSRDSPTCPVTKPFHVYPEGEDKDENGVSVKATLVDHHQVYPAFAYRFDTKAGSVVFSGDTGPATRGNLQVLAQGADVLVHEVIDKNWVNKKFGINPEKGTTPYVLRHHMLTAHTPVEKVGTVARDCNVKTLVLNHIVPGMAPIAQLHKIQDFPGNLIISHDLMQIGVNNFGGVVL